MARIFAFLAMLVIPTAAVPASLADISNRDAVSALKAALTKGTQAAVDKLGVEDGFWGDERVKIPLPDSMKRAESLMRRLGMGKQADDLLLRMNRAAEAAVPEARALFVDSVKKMSVQDAKAIIGGPQDAATQYFRRSVSEPLAQRFLPIVTGAMQKVQLAESYDRFAEHGAQLGLIRKEDANLEEYITRKALDGLFLVMADEEKKIRENPLQETSSILRKVFGTLVR
jgi:hypothetical protein